MSSSTRSATSALLIGLTLLWAAPLEAAKAPSKKDVAAAKAAFGKGKKDFEAGRFKEAIDKYEKAYALTSMPAILFNIGQCHKKLGNWEKAVDYFQRFLAEAPRPIPNEALAQQLLDESKAKIAEAAKKARPAEGPGGTKAATATAAAASAEPARIESPKPADSSATASRPAPDPTARPLITTASTPPPETAKPGVVPADAVAAAAPVEEVRQDEEGGIASKWWFWTLVGAVVVGGGVTAGVLATQQPQPLAQTSLGEIHF
ncbi:MAG TPA: tetratricopeptide repeat protein [Myxococcales bacterium]|jgi:hypothetical protein